MNIQDIQSIYINAEKYVRSFEKETDHFSSLPKICVLKVRPRDEPSQSPILTVVVERTEEVNYLERENNERFVSSAQLKLDYVVIDDCLKSNPRKSFFIGKYHHISGVSLTGGAVYLDLGFDSNGLRIGTLLMNEIVQWARQWPEAQVIPIKLLEAQALTETEKIRRNKFYENFGIQFEYDDPPKNKIGKSRPMLAGSLKTNFSWQQNISVHSVLDTMLDLQTKNEKLESDFQGAQVGIEYLRKQLDGLERRSIFSRILNLIRK